MTTRQLYYSAQFRLLPEMYAALEALAKKTGVPVVALVRVALQDMLDNAEAEGKFHADRR